MPTLTLEVTDEQVKMLTEEAKLSGLTLQEFALLRLLSPRQPTEQKSDMEFEAAAHHVFQKNSELYARLAGRETRVSQAIKRIINRNEELYRRLA